MELIDGFNGRQLVELLGPLPVAEAAMIIFQVAQGLQHAHEQGFIHRDMKPSNLMVTVEGDVKMLDLGLSLGSELRALAPTTPKVVGTLNFMAPEQLVNSDRIDHRADIYSLGETFHFLVYGHTSNISYPEEMKAKEEALPLVLDTLLSRMLAESVDERPGSAKEVAQELAAWAADADLCSLVAQAQQLAPKPVAMPPLIPSVWLEPRYSYGRSALGRLNFKHTKSALALTILCGLLIGLTLFYFQKKNDASRAMNIPVRNQSRQSKPQKLAQPNVKHDLKKANVQKADVNISSRIRISNSKLDFDIFYEAVIVDGQYEWALHAGKTSGVWVTKKQKNESDATLQKWESANLEDFRTEHPQEFAFLGQYLPQTSAELVSGKIFKQPLPANMSFRRKVQDTAMGGQWVDVWLPTQEVWILDSGLFWGGGLSVHVTSDNNTSIYSPTNRRELERNHPEIAELVNQYAPPRFVKASPRDVPTPPKAP